jgi:hypothetical protein
VEHKIIEVDEPQAGILVVSKGVKTLVAGCIQRRRRLLRYAIKVVQGKVAEIITNIEEPSTHKGDASYREAFALTLNKCGYIYN